MIIGKWNRSVILTYLVVAFSLTGMYLAMTVATKYALCCLILAGICDLFDGKVARSCKRTDEEKSFGAELDTLADSISFIALPVVIYLGAGFVHPYLMVLYFLFAVCGIARLAHFNMTTEAHDQPVRHYQGLPVTYTALILPMVYLVYFVLPSHVFVIIFPLVLLGISILNILNIKIAKPKGIAYFLFSLLALVMVMLYLVVL